MNYLAICDFIDQQVFARLDVVKNGIRLVEPYECGSLVREAVVKKEGEFNPRELRPYQGGIVKSLSRFDVFILINPFEQAIERSQVGVKFRSIFLEQRSVRSDVLSQYLVFVAGLPSIWCRSSWLIEGENSCNVKG
ncbi:hypothetical protein D3C85_1067740 [compost metagenome]